MEDQPEASTSTATCLGSLSGPKATRTFLVHPLVPGPLVNCLQPHKYLEALYLFDNFFYKKWAIPAMDLVVSHPNRILKIPVEDNFKNPISKCLNIFSKILFSLARPALQSALAIMLVC